MAKKKLKALLDEDLCTGCEICVSVCPVDCIDKKPGPEFNDVLAVCHIDLPRCIGCKLCAQVCPWDCIEMLEAEQMEVHPAYSGRSVD